MHELKPSEVIARHGKSFYWAGLLLPKKTRQTAFLLYALCRQADDWADGSQSLEWKRSQIAAWEAYLHATPDSGIRDLFRLVPYKLYADLCQGLLFDCQERILLSTKDQIRTYCYWVAGSVGLMMAYLFGVKDKWTLTQAEALGTAMQLTNIARDIQEDAGRARWYAPGLQIDLSNAPEITKELVSRAYWYYLRAASGIRELPRPVFKAIAAAAINYSDILGVLERQDFRGPRAVLPTYRKILNSIGCWLAPGTMLMIALRRWRVGLARVGRHAPYPSAYQLKLWYNPEYEESKTVGPAV